MDRLDCHDRLNYMPAWVHQAIAVECEFIESLFGFDG